MLSNRLLLLVLLLSPVFVNMSHAATSQPTVVQTVQQNLSINKATLKELSKLKGMSANKAHAIILYRKKHGAFKSFAELKKISGFKRLNADKLKLITDQLTLS